MSYLSPLKTFAALTVAGIAYSFGGGTAEDMMILDTTGMVVGVHHVGFDAPDPGRAIDLIWTTNTSGVGVGSAVFEVVKGFPDEVVLCSVTVPCVTSPGEHVRAVECDAEITTGDHIGIRPGAASNCGLLPVGKLVPTFRWQ